MLRRLLFILWLSTFAGAQQPPAPVQDEPDKPFPGTHKQIEEILKANHERNLKDLEKMARLVEQVQADARKDSHNVISLQSLRNLEQIEKLSKGIRERMKFY